MDKYMLGTEADDMDTSLRPSALPAVMVPAMAYVPTQFYDTVYEIDEGYSRGTIFPELDKPFMMGCGVK